MLLAPADAEQFYRIWWPLLTYVNRVQEITPDFPTDGKRSPDVVFPVREALWNRDTLLDGFVAENPAGLGDEDLEIAANWRGAVRGTFAVFRHLARHSVFLATDSTEGGERGYAVLGILSPLDEMLPLAPPLYMEATLLPFKQQIIHDGLIVPYNVILGAGIRENLKRTYRDIQEGSGILSRLPPSEEGQRRGIDKGNAALLKAFRAYLIGAGLSDSKAEEHLRNVADFGFELRDSVAPRPLNAANVTLVQARLETHPKASVSYKRFARFLYETERGEPERVEELQRLRQRG